METVLWSLTKLAPVSYSGSLSLMALAGWTESNSGCSERLSSATHRWAQGRPVVLVLSCDLRPIESSRLSNEDRTNISNVV